jgi:hypothetical protein
MEIILIIITSFLVIGLGLQPTNTLIVVLFGVGLGLIIDEFPHWTGNVKELIRNVLIIPGALKAVLVVESFILVLIFLKYSSII